MTKAEIRRRILKIRESQPKKEKIEKEKKILTRLERFPEFKRAKEFFTYLSHRGEVATDQLIKKYFGKKCIVVPKIDSLKSRRLSLHKITNPHEFENGSFGIREPKKSLPESKWDDIEVAVIPGVAFDKRGHRIGFGGGYFDRLLKKLHCIKISLCFEFQLVDRIPEKSHDVAVNIIVTDRRIIRVGPHTVRPRGKR